MKQKKVNVEGGRKKKGSVESALLVVKLNPRARFKAARLSRVMCEDIM
jgi:hypothetical protein